MLPLFRQAGFDALAPNPSSQTLPLRILLLACFDVPRVIMQLTQVLASLSLLSAVLAAPLTSPVAASAAAPAPAVVHRQAGGGECGRNDYSSGDVAAAADAACDYLARGEQVGSNDYPHRYNNYEGFDFDTSGPWYEFPILAGGRVFDGSTSPGADRVVINGGCAITALLTHSGAGGNAFLECDY